MFLFFNKKRKSFEATSLVKNTKKKRSESKMFLYQTQLFV